MVKEDLSSSSRSHNLAGGKPSSGGVTDDNMTSWSTAVTGGFTDAVNWSTTSSSKHHAMTLDSCGPSEFIFIFYAYYYGLMLVVTVIGVVGNSAVIR